jgi:hypothetical protein
MTDATDRPRQYLVTVTPLPGTEMTSGAPQLPRLPVAPDLRLPTPVPPDPKALLALMHTYFVELRKRMSREGILAVDLATEAGIAPTQLSRYMRGKVDARMSSIEKIETAFDILVRRKKKRGE